MTMTDASRTAFAHKSAADWYAVQAAEAVAWEAAVDLNRAVEGLLAVLPPQTTRNAQIAMLTLAAQSANFDASQSALKSPAQRSTLEA